MTPTTEERYPFDETVANMLSNTKYNNSYLFYGHMLAQCRVVFDNKLPAPAGVSFQIDHYNLYINPVGIPADEKNPEGVEGFNSFTLEQRLGIIKHEMLHILNGHVARKEDRDHQKFNIASDCAINQLIERKHLPEWCIFPDQFPKIDKVPENLTSEQYYSYIEYEDMDDDDPGQGKGQGQGDSLGDHGKWDESQGDGELQDDVTKNMAERAVSQTQKSRGDIPSQISEWLDLFTHKRELNWKQVLRGIVGNKRVGSRKTIMRQDRRLPDMPWIKGRTKDRMFDIAIISDTSGSVSDEALLTLWGEVRHICDVTQSGVSLVQVDTQASVPEILQKNTKILSRKHCGGTYMTPGIEAFRKAGITYDCLVVTTDGYLSSEDVNNFLALKKRVIWLVEKDGEIMPEMSQGKMQAFKLST